MNEIKLFTHEQFGDIRTIEIEGEPWFVGRDICTAFGDTTPSRSLDRVDDDDKRVIPITDSLGRQQNAIFVNESGMFSLLFTMQPQKANKDGVQNAHPIETQHRIRMLREFKRWITHEVLPSIRKTGSYAIPNVSPTPDLVQMNQYLLSLVQMQKRGLASAQARMFVPNTYTVTQIANEFGFTAQDLNQRLASLGIQHKEDGQWVLEDEYADCGYTVNAEAPGIDADGNPCTNNYTRWTKTGREFIHSQLRTLGFRPLKECTYIP